MIHIETNFATNSGASITQDVPPYPAILTADLSGLELAHMEGANWHQAYHYDLIMQPYRYDFAADESSPLPADRYLIRATKYLLGRMDTAFYVLPVQEGEKIRFLRGFGQKDAALKKYVCQHILNTAYSHGKGFYADQAELFVEPVSGTFVAFCFEWDPGHDIFDLLVQPHRSPLAAAPAWKRFVARMTHTDGFGDASTAFYEMPSVQGEAVLAGASDLERTNILAKLAGSQTHLELPASSRWRLLLGRDDLHTDVDHRSPREIAAPVIDSPTLRDAKPEFLEPHGCLEPVRQI